MAVEITTIPRVYIAASAFWRSIMHTAYVSPRGNPIAPGEEVPMLSLTFYHGIARNVPTQVYAAFHDAGIATTERPRLRDEDEGA